MNTKNYNLEVLLLKLLLYIRAAITDHQFSR